MGSERASDFRDEDFEENFKNYLLWTGRNGRLSLKTGRLFWPSLEAACPKKFGMTFII
jgi:hypothetical protein